TLGRCSTSVADFRRRRRRLPAGSSAPGHRRRRASPSASPPRAVAPSPVRPLPSSSDSLPTAALNPRRPRHASGKQPNAIARLRPAASGCFACGDSTAAAALGPEPCRQSCLPEIGAGGRTAKSRVAGGALQRQHMDKSWINDRQFSPAYIKGVKAFMRFVQERCDVNSPIHCPCSECNNRKQGPLAEVEDHIYIYGMSSTYTRWIYHGEPLIAETNQDTEIQEPDHDMAPDHDMTLDGIATLEYQDEDDDGDDGIPELLGDLYTARDKDNGHPKFDKILEDSKCALYPGCGKFTKFSFLVKLLHLKSYYRITNTAFDALLQLLSLAFPDNNALPRSYNEVKYLLRELGLGYESIHVCKNNCVLYRKKYAKLEHCPVCKESRWKDPKGGKRVPRKVIRYFPLKPRLQRLFMSRETAENTQWHKLKRKVVENEMRHPSDGEAWKDFDREYEWFAQDARNLRLGLATDGFNPFGHMSSSYSMWPVFIIPYNLPPWECMDQSNFIMTLLIPGPKSPGKDFDIFLQPLIEDLLELWKGIRTYDAFTKNILHYMLQFFALATLSGRSTKGYFACVHCDEDPLSQALRNKIGYFGHCRYLPMNHHWRRSKLFNGKYEKRGKPREFSTAELLEKLEEVKDIRPGKHPLNRKRKRTNKDEPTWHLRVSLWDLPYWSQLKLRHNLDVMHIEKNICENLLWTFLRVEGKTKDTINARLDLEDLGIRKELHLVQNGDAYDRPHACYTMTNDQRDEFCKFLRTVKFPDGYAANLARCVDMDGHKVQHLKTHDCHILLQRILPVALRGLIREDIYKAICELGNFFKQLCSKTLKRDVLHGLKDEIPIILCKLEKIYPPAFFDVMVHLAVHLPDEALFRGPVQYGWMYPVERRLYTLKRYVRNRSRPEGSIAEAYIVDECLTFCSRYFGDVETRFNRKGRPNSGLDSAIPEDDLSVFTHGVKLLGTAKVSYNEVGFDKLVWYVLNNCPEVDQYKTLFREKLEHENASDVDQRLEKGFAKWFKEHIAKLHCHGVLIKDDIYALSCGPDKRIEIYSSCIANGVRYRTVSHEKYRTTQNSGVMTEGTHKNEYIDFYGVLNEIIVLQYPSNKQFTRSVVLFRCDWYDLEGKKTGTKDDGYFRSINVERCWYKNDPYILATQSTQVFYLHDTKLGKGWKVVQKFEHRHLYDVTETEEHTSDVAYQDDICSSIEYILSDIDPCLEHLHRVDEDACRIDAAIVDKARGSTEDALHDTDSEDEDDTLQQYYSDNDRPQSPMNNDDTHSP
ncbi:hypothetical protein U9M48_039342, partial [Paspalum notatum var. saurae]